MTCSHAWEGKACRAVNQQSLGDITDTMGERWRAALEADIEGLQSDKRMRRGTLIRILSQTWSRTVVISYGFPNAKAPN
jgi:hypothetical protein